MFSNQSNIPTYFRIIKTSDNLLVSENIYINTNDLLEKYLNH